jgi:outer membrane protein
MKIKLILLVTLVLLSFQSYAQKKWTLTDCIDYAHANNLQIKRQQLQAEISKNNFFQSKLNILPSVNAGFDRNYNFGSSLIRDTIYDSKVMQDNMWASANVDLFTGLQNYNRIKMNEFSMLAKLQDVEKEKIEITLNIATAYLDILFKKELLQVTTSQMDIAMQQVERTKKLVDAGSVAKGDLLEIQAQLASEKYNVTNAKNNLKLSYLNLTQILDLDSVAGFEIDFQDTISINLLSEILPEMDVYYTALGYLPHIKSAELQLKSYEKAMAIQKGKLSPTIYASTSIGSTYIFNNEAYEVPSYSKQIDLNMNKSVGIGISIPIFNKWQVMNGISNSKIQVSDAELQLSQLKQQLYKEIQQAHNDAVSARDKYNSAVEAVSSYNESFKYTEQKYNVGIVNSVEYNIAKNNFIKAQSDLLQAKYQYIFSVKILDFYKGVPISL